MVRYPRWAGPGLGVAVAVCLGTAACSSPGATPSETAAPPADDLPRGALDEFWDGIRGGEPESDALTQHTQLQEAIAACMNELGFEYTPMDFESRVDVTTAADLGLAFGTREYAEQFGYGISTDAMGYYAMTARTDEDPNIAYVRGLSEAAQDEYTSALYGRPVPVDQMADAESAGGCETTAVDAVLSGPEANDAFDPMALWEEEQAMRQAARDDERVAVQRAEWVGCMADAGYPDMVDPGDGILTGTPVEQLQAEFSDLLVAAQAEMPVAPTMKEASAQASRAALMVKEELAPKEIDMAVADLDCRDETGYARVLAEVEVEYEAEYFAAHRAEYEAWAEAWAEVRAARDQDR